MNCYILCALLVACNAYAMELERAVTLTPPSLLQICTAYINTKLLNTYRRLSPEVTKALEKAEKDSVHLAPERLHRLNALEKKIPHIAHVTPNKVTFAYLLPQEFYPKFNLDVPSFLYAHNKKYAAQFNVIMHHLLDNATHKGSYHPIETYHETAKYLLPSSCLSLAHRIASQMCMWRSKTIVPTYSLRYKNSGHHAIDAVRPLHDATVVAYPFGLEVVHDASRPAKQTVTKQTVAIPANFINLLACSKDGTRACYKTLTNYVVGIVTMSHKKGKTEALTREVITRSPHTVQTAALSDNGVFLAVGLTHYDHHMIKIINLHNDSEHVTLTPRQGEFPLHRLAFSPANTYLISCHKEGSAYLWKNLPWRCEGVFHIDILNPSGRDIRSIIFSADESVLVMHEENHDNVLCYNPETTSCTHTIQHKGGIISVAIDSSGTLIATGGNDGTLRVWDKATGSCLQTLTCPAPIPPAIAAYDIEAAQNKATALSFIKEGRGVMIGCEQGDLFCWYVPDNFEKEIFFITLEDAIKKKNLEQQQALEKDMYYTILSNRQNNALHTYRTMHKQGSSNGLRYASST